MKKLFLVALASISLSVFGGEKAVENNLVTTNEVGQITRIVILTKGDKTTTVVFEDAGFQVPLKYRAKWSTMTEDEKNQVRQEFSMPVEYTDVVYPVKVEYISTRKIKNIESTRVVRLREDDENE